VGGRRRTTGFRVVAVVALAFPVGVWVAATASGGQMQSKKGMSLLAQLNARQEVPKPVGVPAAATGSFTATLVPAGSAGTISWRLTFRRLSGRAVAAHVHVARAGRAGQVALALCGPCTARARGTSRVSAGLRRTLERGGAYVNVHTPKNPAGEIRGQIRVGAGSGQAPPPQPAPPPETEPPAPYPPYP
jgi:CHRD domain